eukprot:2699649-Amphidinium_carterae.1
MPQVLSRHPVLWCWLNQGSLSAPKTCQAEDLDDAVGTLCLSRRGPNFCGKSAHAATGSLAPGVGGKCLPVQCRSQGLSLGPGALVTGVRFRTFWRVVRSLMKMSLGVFIGGGFA